ncbi:MAG: hypothetical protein DMG05_14635 [Acidobacteria bacterium]|nr:MAG: hypothetical protein DMG05_14635 [Acidobacteriota bacterium]
MEARRATSPRASPEARVLEMIRALLTELGSHQALRRVTLQASLERDLGIGSLERVELLLRLEKEFSIRLADRVMTEAETPADLVNALLRRHSGHPENFRAAQILSPLEPPGFSYDPSSAATLDEVLRQYAQAEPKRPHIHLRRQDGEIYTIGYGKLFDGASAVASGLFERGLERGQTVGIMLPTCEDFFFAFFGILQAGGVPVPIYPPFRPDRLEEYAQRQSLILRNAEVRLLITFHEAERLLRLLRPRIPRLSAVTTVDSLGKAPGRSMLATAARHDVALIQYTSGSTGDPKGVVLTHANLIANIRGIGQAIGIGPTDVGVSWLPLYHDMGLIGSWLCSLYFGFPITILSPLDFLTRPERWLWAIHNYRATLSAAPNFAYELCVRKIDPSALEGLDLSCWRAAFNGAEPVSPDTLTRFSQRFEAYGFRPETLLPVYGLAESSVALTVPPLGRIPRVDCIDRTRFEQNQKAELSKSSTLRFVSVGRPLSGHEVRVVDDQGIQVEERRQGRIQFRGPSTMAGYFRNPAATRQVFLNGWLDTGDLGYQAEGELFITARLKDVIIKGGRNLYPQEVEEVTSEVEGVRRGCVAAFGVTDPKMGTERLVVVAETRESDSQARDRLTADITAHVGSSLGIPPDIVHLVPPFVFARRPDQPPTSAMVATR